MDAENAFDRSNSFFYKSPLASSAASHSEPTAVTKLQSATHPVVLTRNDISVEEIANVLQAIGFRVTEPFIAHLVDSMVAETSVNEISVRDHTFLVSDLSVEYYQIFVPDDGTITRYNGFTLFPSASYEDGDVFVCDVRDDFINFEAKIFKNTPSDTLSLELRWSSPPPSILDGCPYRERWNVTNQALLALETPQIPESYGCQKNEGERHIFGQYKIELENITIIVNDIPKPQKITKQRWSTDLQVPTLAPKTRMDLVFHNKPATSLVGETLRLDTPDPRIVARLAKLAKVNVSASLIRKLVDSVQLGEALDWDESKAIASGPSSMGIQRLDRIEFSGDKLQIDRSAVVSDLATEYGPLVITISPNSPDLSKGYGVTFEWDPYDKRVSNLPWEKILKVCRKHRIR